MYRHGHKITCPTYLSMNPSLHTQNQELQNKHKITKNALQEYLTNLQIFYKYFDFNMSYTYEEVYECDYNHHRCKLNNVQSLWRNMTYDTFLKKIEAGDLKGYLTICDLKLKKTSCQEFMGFCISRTNSSNFPTLSPYTQNLLKNEVSKSLIVGRHSFPG